MKESYNNKQNRSLLERLDGAETRQSAAQKESAASQYVQAESRKSQPAGRNSGTANVYRNRTEERNDIASAERIKAQSAGKIQTRDRQSTSLTERPKNQPANRSKTRDGLGTSRTEMSRTQPTRRSDNYGRSQNNSRNNSKYYYDRNGHRRKRRRRKKGSKGFRIALVIIALVLAIAVTIANLALSSFLTRYESDLPTNVVEQVIDELKEGRYESLNIVAYDKTPISDEAAFAKDGYFSDYFKSHMNSGEVSYRKLNGESTDTNYIYAIRVGDDDFLKISLDKETDESADDTGTWTMTGGQILDDKVVTSTIRIQAPQDAVVYVNGREAGDEYVVSSYVVVEQLQNLVNSGFIGEESAAYVKELSVSGLFADTNVTLTNADGTAEDCVLTDGLYSGGFKATDEFAAARIDRVTEMIYPWCYYFSGDGSFYNLSQYIWDYSPAYNTIQAADTSWMQEHSDISIDNIVVENFRRYSDTCFSCDVRFQENIYQWGELARTWDSYMTWIYVNGADTFYMADYITHNAS